MTDDKIQKATAAVTNLLEMQDEVIQAMILVYMLQNGHTTEGSPCSEETIHKIVNYVASEMMSLELLSNVFSGRLKMRFSENSDEPLFSITDDGAKQVKGLSG